MKTVAYLGTGTLDRRLPTREPYLAVTYSSEWIKHCRARVSEDRSGSPGRPEARTEGVLRSLPHLSRRELDCLRWTSEGKTVWECGVILGLSPHTVRCYLERTSQARRIEQHARRVARPEVRPPL
ncbi:helix-turn-helix transcriptional regulator [Mesorhizobium sp.]|uniref:helix-turn-helix domain-containing protein n=1 Tax=Mesorhizobium sp. TaxID=1871066 RepID=UPI00338E79E5